MKKNTIILLFVSVLFTCSSYAQQSSSLMVNEQLLKKNAFYVNVGSSFIFNDVNFVYERNFFHQNYSYYNLQIGFGLMEAAWGPTYQQFTVCPSWLFGKDKNHMELNLGVTVSYDFDGYRHSHPSSLTFFNYLEAFPAAYLGYRYQKPEGKFLFRVGIGFPEQIGVGVGWCF